MVTAMHAAWAQALEARLGHSSHSRIVGPPRQVNQKILITNGCDNQIFLIAAPRTRLHFAFFDVFPLNLFPAF